MKTIQVLSIGNSFSEDAQRYLHDYAECQGVSMETVNLFIPGCTLWKHFQNMKSGKREYLLEVNGHKAGGFYVSIEEALLAREWDVITLQQASHLSFTRESYFPYITHLAEFIRELCPKAKLMIHQTWAYESESRRILDHGFQTYDEMFAAVKACYEEAACAIGADGIIPSGEAFQHALHNGIAGIHRDTFHAKFGLGRFLLAMVWYRSITGNTIVSDRRIPLDEEISEEEYRIALKASELVVC